MASEPLPSPSSFSSPIVGTVGRERPAGSGPVVRGVFWGVGATPSAPLGPIGIEEVPLMLPGIFLVALASGSSDRQEMSEGEKAIGSNQTRDAGHCNDCTTMLAIVSSDISIFYMFSRFLGFYLFISSHFLVAGLIYTISSPSSASRSKMGTGHMGCLNWLSELRSVRCVRAVRGRLSGRLSHAIHCRPIYQVNVGFHLPYPLDRGLPVML